MTQPRVHSFFDKVTNTATHVLMDPSGKHAAIIDSVWDYDFKAGRTSTASADAVLEFVRAERLAVEWILETHIHADHLSAGAYLKDKLGAPIGIGAGAVGVQKYFKEFFGSPPDFTPDGRQFDRLFGDGETFSVGSLEVRVLPTPGHTPGCVTYVAGDAAFIGDTLFAPDYGTARTDFPGGDAAVLYRSVMRLYALPPETRLYLCHDYMPNGRATIFQTSVRTQRAENVHLRDGVSEAAFVKLRTERDRKLDMPVLILPAVQVNMRGGRLPPPEPNGTSYLKIPVNRL